MRGVPTLDQQQAYELYAQRLTYKEIAEAMNMTVAQVQRRVIKYSKKTSSPYPLPRRNMTGQYMYDLYLNGVSVRDIAVLLGVHKDKVYLRIRAYCGASGLRYPFRDYRGEDAYYLKVDQGLSYQKVAELVGFADRSICYRAVRRFVERSGLQMP